MIGLLHRESTIRKIQLVQLNKVFFVLCLLFTIQTSWGQSWVGGVSSDFLDATNWSEVPDFTALNTYAIPAGGSFSPVLNADLPATCTSISVNNGETFTTFGNIRSTATNFIGGTVDIKGGIWNAAKFYVGNGAGNGVVNIAAGAEVIGTYVWRIGYGGDSGTINVEGGTLTLEGANGSFTLGYSKPGTLNINSGIVNVNYSSFGSFSIVDNKGNVTIDAGRIVIPGDQTAAVQVLIDANKIKAIGVALAEGKPISCKYDIESNTTIVIAGVFVNYSPVAEVESISVALNGTATFLDGGKSSVLANDTDKENNPLTAILVNSPAHGTLALNSDGTFSYIHDGSNTTTDSFSYKTNDGNSDSNIVNVTITISHEPSPSGLTYKNPHVFTRGVYVAPLNPTVGGGAIISYSVIPDFPAGLSLNTQTGVISGTPRVAAVTKEYTITASNLAGSTSTKVTITVNDLAGVGPNTRPMEYLDRGLVALGINNGVFLSWRMVGSDNPDVGFNLYKNGIKLNTSPITAATNYVDAAGSASDLYKVEAILPSGNEMSAEVTVWPYAPPIEPGKPYLARLEIPIPAAPGPEYIAGDMSVGDLDGDGKYELIFEWEPSGFPENAYLEAIDLKGNSLWRISYGQNTTYNGVPFMVYDLDGDGKAEVATVTAPGTKDGLGNYLSKGPAATDDDSVIIPRNSGHLMEDPAYMTVFNGMTGAEMATVNYPISIGPIETHEATWDDGYGKRAASIKAAVLYDKEKGPLLVFARGIYSRIGMGAYTWDGNYLKQEWLFDSDKLAEPDKSKYRGEGNHAVTVADVDGDGSDELMYGACAIDNNGNGLYTTGRGHGDSHALGDLDPSRPGLEYFQPHENSTYGFSFRDAATGEIIWEVLSPADVGRAWAADITGDNPGVEISVVGDYIDNGLTDDSSVFDTKGSPLTYGYSAYLQPIYFDGDIQRELRKDSGVDDVNNGGRMLTAWYYGASSIHSTKQDANLVADILGDWREEMIFRKGDNSAFVVFSTWIPTEHKVYTLMHDPAYRMQVATQNVGYNQPANLSYYLPNGSPKPDIRIVGAAVEVDSDNDGVMDSLDVCPNTPSGQAVNASGCAQSQLDEDNDGVKNDLDSCPNTPSGQTVNASGCAQSQLDDDNDGVKNDLDTCPNTPSSDQVDSHGCTVISQTAIKTYVETPTCPGKANGKIVITTSLTGYSFTIKVKGPSVDQTLTNLTIAPNTIKEISNLGAGTYEVIVAIPSNNFEQIYSVVVKEISAITAKRVADDKIVSYTVSGSNEYLVTVNGVSRTYITGSGESSKIMIDSNLLQATNTISIETNSDCQGVVVDNFNLSPSVSIHPNPTSDIVYIEGVSKGLIQVYSGNGSLLFEKDAEITKSLDLSGYAAGVYLVTIIQGTESETFKVILK